MILLMVMVFCTLLLLFWGLRQGYQTSIWLILCGILLASVGYVMQLSDLNPLVILSDSLKRSFGSTAYIIMILFGYNRYMQHIGANDALCAFLIKPLSKVHYPYLLLMIFFIIASLLSVVITSAAALASLLIATCYPVLRQVGLSKASIAAVIVSSPGIMPSPMAIETHMSASALQLDINAYILLSYSITLPMLLLMSATHGIWQKRLDKYEPTSNEPVPRRERLTSLKSSYALLPLLPLILFIVDAVLLANPKSDIVQMVLVSLAISLAWQVLRERNPKEAIQNLAQVWQGMATGLIQVGTIVMSAGFFVDVLKHLGTTEALVSYFTTSQLPGSLLILLLVAAIIVTGISSGSGLALYFGLAPLVPTFAALAQITGWKLATLLEVTAHTSRTFSTLAAVMIVTSTQLDISITSIIKRTALPVCVALGFLVLVLYV
jgi:C4-dicarboxylate transporter, DcuC family